MLLVLCFSISVAFADTSAPTAPLGVSATAVSPTQVNLFWNAPSGFTITGYKIEFKTANGNYATLVTTTGTATATQTYYSHTGLTTGTAYSYKVYAINSIGTSVASSEVAVTPSSSSVGVLPGQPTGLIVTPISTTQANLSWSAPSSNGGHPITGYKIEYRIGAGTYSELTTVSGTTTTYSHTGMSTGQVYVYRVYAVTSFGLSEKPSTEATVLLKSSASSSAPSAPPSLSATAISPTQINLSWSAPSSNGGYSISGYKVEVKKGTASYSTLISNTGNQTTTYSHTGLTTGTAYSYKVYAINSIGTSTASPEASATPTSASVFSSPAPPTGVTATSVSGTQINLSWAAPSNNGGSVITGYKLEYKTGSSGTYSVLVVNSGNTATTYSHTGLTTGQLYVYRISAINSVGTSNPSPEASSTPIASTSSSAASSAPGSPTNLIATSVSGTQINLSWAAPSNNGGSPITGYKIESKKGSGSYEVIMANTGNTLTTYSHAGLIPATTYYYRVSAINSIGTGGPFGESTAIPQETTTPTLSGTVIGPTQVHLTWTTPSQTYKQSISGFKVEEKLGESYKVINDNVGTVNGYTIKDAITGKSHTYVVSALFVAGSSPRSNEISVTPTATSAAPAGFSTAISQIINQRQTGTDPESIKKMQQEELTRKIQQAREELLKKTGKIDSDKAKAAKEEAKKANEKAIRDAAAARKQLTAEKQAQLKAPKNTTVSHPDKTIVESKKPKTLEEARKSAEEAKQRALEKANIKVKNSTKSQDDKQKELEAAKAAAWEKAKKALEEYKKSQK